MTQFKNAFPAWRIFVFGADVTEHVMSCSFSAHDGRAPNMCEFVLDNKNDQFTITEEDIYAMRGGLAQGQLRSDPSLPEIVRADEDRAVENISTRALGLAHPNSVKDA